MELGIRGGAANEIDHKPPHHGTLPILASIWPITNHPTVFRPAMSDVNRCKGDQLTDGDELHKKQEIFINS
jgi:hypothetical protein